VLASPELEVMAALVPIVEVSTVEVRKAKASPVPVVVAAYVAVDGTEMVDVSVTLLACCVVDIAEAVVLNSGSVVDELLASSDDVVLTSREEVSALVCWNMEVSIVVSSAAGSGTTLVWTVMIGSTTVDVALSDTSMLDVVVGSTKWEAVLSVPTTVKVELSDLLEDVTVVDCSRDSAGVVLSITEDVVSIFSEKELAVIPTDTVEVVSVTMWEIVIESIVLLVAVS
jgi:hypothetical protein